MIYIINDNKNDINYILNYLKPWDDWSLLSLTNDVDFKQHVNNHIIKYDGTSYSYDKTSDSYFTNNENTIIKTFLKETYDYKSHYYETLSELQSLETFLLNQLKKLIKVDYFWNNINTTID